jgi:NADPH-dependent 2,4-dienoyl-CoA reductase/sulfur reductase-like enzyme
MSPASIQEPNPLDQSGNGTIEDDSELYENVVIVGAGPAGLMLA